MGIIRGPLTLLGMRIIQSACALAGLPCRVPTGSRRVVDSGPLGDILFNRASSRPTTSSRSSWPRCARSSRPTDPPVHVHVSLSRASATVTAISDVM
ncbi:hypothetical protein B0T24DRAFT_253246 [Lasiosphaeria ovina]|uniref:Uncharacterized protein n=1 Tax=Lasiosphaeria ovina TaxID=92902 RepID=A0AAE0KBY5_9PEZI|nr:hypothetical protein B0T24DRAFT_253246 [Lasiosphaeria ovina]